MQKLLYLFLFFDDSNKENISLLAEFKANSFSVFNNCKFIEISFLLLSSLYLKFEIHSSILK